MIASLDCSRTDDPFSRTFHQVLGLVFCLFSLNANNKDLAYYRLRLSNDNNGKPEDRTSTSNDEHSHSD
jgi:hypothetical protein